MSEPVVIKKKPTLLYYFFYTLTNYLFSLFVLLTFLPIFPFIALSIYIDSPGNIFYIQERVGKNNKIFKILKIRSMVVDADKRGDAWTLKEDDRITRVGKWIRKFRIDELPQILNIIKGDMALIGPRPEAKELSDLFSEKITNYRLRYTCLPGITGWAQVNYENTCSVEGAEKKFQYDLEWLQKRSVLMDIKIILKTIKVMLTGFGTS